VTYRSTQEAQVNDPTSIACTLGPSDLRHRLDEIAALGAKSLIGHELKESAHTLRFRRDDGTRHQLEEIAAAEARCCSFLDLNISEHDSELVLTIAVTEGGQQVAEALALAFIQPKQE
jgi:hypothetical protein